MFDQLVLSLSERTLAAHVTQRGDVVVHLLDRLGPPPMPVEPWLATPATHHEGWEAIDGRY